MTKTRRKKEMRPFIRRGSHLFSEKVSQGDSITEKPFSFWKDLYQKALNHIETYDIDRTSLRVKILLKSEDIRYTLSSVLEITSEEDIRRVFR